MQGVAEAGVRAITREGQLTIAEGPAPQGEHCYDLDLQRVATED